MFSWANKQLEKLSETLAPPPSTPTHRFLSSLASQNEPAASAILNDPHEPLDPYALIHPSKGTSAVHVAASHGAINILRELILHRGVPVDTADYQGCTPLHHASQGSSVPPNVALSAVKFLVEECGAGVLRKNSQNQTAYDVGSSQAVRGYLLPKQLQLETQECLDNGGRGLMPGIDMGGMKVNYANVAPPPVMGGPLAVHGAGPPPTGGMISNPAPPNNFGANDPSAALMQPPPVRIDSSFSGTSFATQPPAATAPMMPQPPVMTSDVKSGIGAHNNSSSAPVDSNLAYPGTAAPPTKQPRDLSLKPAAAGESNAPANSESTSVQQPKPASQPDSQPPVSSQPEQVQQPEQKIQHQEQLLVQTQIPNPPTAQTLQQQHQQQPKQQPSRQPPELNSSAPNSGYALRGGNANSAFVLDEKSFTASGRRLYKPDGFHTSSNDKELQMKYGHVENDFEKNKKLAIPPPPTSTGGSIGVGWNNSNTGNSGGSNAYPASGGVNPYSAVVGTTRVTGYIGGLGRARYPTYCAVSDSVSAPTSLNGMGMSPSYGSAAPSYAVFNPANSGHNADNNVQMGQTQQWAGDGQQSMQAGYGGVSVYGANPASGNEAYGTYGYNQQQYPAQQHPTAQQWNAPHAAASNVNTYGQPTEYVQGYSPSPHQNQQQQNQQYESGGHSAATMFATPSPQQNNKTPGSNDAFSASTMFISPPAVSNTTFSPPSGNVGHSSTTATIVNAQDLFASPPSKTETASKDRFPSPPPSEDANTSAKAIAAVESSEPSANDHFAVASPATESNFGTISAKDQVVSPPFADSNIPADHIKNFPLPPTPSNNTSNDLSAEDHFAAPTSIETTPFSNDNVNEQSALAGNAVEPSSEASPGDEFVNATPLSTAYSAADGNASEFATTPSSVQDASSFFGSPPKEGSTTVSTSDTSSYFGTAEKLGKTELSAESPPISTKLETSSTSNASPAQSKSFGGLPPPPSLGNFSKPSGSKHPSTPSARSSFLPPPPVISNSISSPPAPSAPDNNDDDGPVEQMSEVSLNDS